MEYGSRNGGGRQPSGGNLNAPIGGLGKLPVGSHVVTVLSVVRGPLKSTVIWADSANHCHAEDVEWVPQGIERGVEGRLLVGLSRGAVVCRDGARFCAQDAKTLEPLTDWVDSPAAVYAAITAKRLPLATTVAVEFAHDNGRFEPKLYHPQAWTAAVADTNPAPEAKL